jgi:gliding motility-associated-like protein
MKKILLYILLFFFSFFWKDTTIFAQTYVNIPDANFAAFLQAKIPSAMNGSLMDTSNILVTTTTDSLYISNKNILNLFGIQYFKSLLLLDCSFNHLSSLPSLSNSLRILLCTDNQLTSLPSLSNSLQTLYCLDNQLTSLPILPSRLKFLYCYNNQLTNISALPDSLIYLVCDNNQLTSLPALPNSLTYLKCPVNQLTSLPTLPNALTYLDCSRNKLTSLPSLPDSLNFFDCENNQISCFPHFPNSITTLYYSFPISGNPYNCLPNYTSLMGPQMLACPLCNTDNSNGCPISTYLPTQIIIPNIFTPNGDNINDEFLIKGSNLNNFNCKIYDRWGSLIYQWSDINSGWNSKNKSGVACNDGTYYYVVSYTDNKGVATNKNGFFELVR